MTARRDSGVAVAPSGTKLGHPPADSALTVQVSYCYEHLCSAAEPVLTSTLPSHLGSEVGPVPTAGSSSRNWWSPGSDKNPR